MNDNARLVERLDRMAEGSRRKDGKHSAHGRAHIAAAQRIRELEAALAAARLEGIREAADNELYQEIADRLGREWIAPDGRRYETSEQRERNANPPF